MLYMSSADSLNPFACISPILSEMRDGSHIPSSARALKKTADSINDAAAAIVLYVILIWIPVII